MTGRGLPRHPWAQKKAPAMAHLLALLTLALISYATPNATLAWEVKLPTTVADAAVDDFPVIHMLRPLLGSSGHLRSSGVSCASWRLGVETNNVRDWYNIPAECVDYVGHYMLGVRYRQDSALVVREAIAYVEGLALAGDGKEVWVFDIDETSLSNVPYYAAQGFGAKPYNATLFNEYVANATAPTLPESLKLYNKLLSLGVKIVFLTGRHEYQRQPTVKNLKSAGYHTWEKLILRGDTLKSSVVPYKSGERQKLIDEGYKIIGNIGDQWSDILGSPEGDRTFKLPDPMYYVG